MFNEIPRLVSNMFFVVGVRFYIICSVLYFILYAAQLGAARCLVHLIFHFLTSACPRLVYVALLVLTHRNATSSGFCNLRRIHASSLLSETLRQACPLNFKHFQHFLNCLRSPKVTILDYHAEVQFPSREMYLSGQHLFFP